MFPADVASDNLSWAMTAVIHLRPHERIMRFLIMILTLLATMFSAASAAEVRLSVAASMTDATRELIATYQQQKGITLLPNFASSGSLAKQISVGAPADIFISANPAWMSYLTEKRLIAADTVRNFARNSLVFVGKNNPEVTSLSDLTSLDRIALASPRSAPAGQYAEQALKAAGVFGEIRNKLILAKDVRQALMYADRGEADGAFVYRTDALLLGHATILLEVPQTLYDPVVYPAGLTSEGNKNRAAVDFFNYLESIEAAAILQKHGFVVK